MLLFLSCCGKIPKIIVLDDPLNKQEHFELGLAYENKQEFNLAKREYLKARPMPMAYFSLANLFFHENNYQQAENYYKFILNKNPFHLEAANNLAWLYLIENKNLIEAEYLAEKAYKYASDAKKANFKDTLDKIKAKRMGKKCHGLLCTQ